MELNFAFCEDYCTMVLFPSKRQKMHKSLAIVEIARLLNCFGGRSKTSALQSYKTVNFFSLILVLGSAHFIDSLRRGLKSPPLIFTESKLRFKKARRNSLPFDFYVALLFSVILVSKNCNCFFRL